MYIDEEKRPEPVSATNFAVAVVLHALFFAVLWFAGQMSFREKEVVIPIELTVVPFENLDGNENEPPPVDDPPKPIDPPKPKTVTPPPPPPPPPKVETKVDAVVKEPEKPKKPQKTKEELEKERLERIRKEAKLKDPPKQPDPPKPEPPKKTKEELLKERLDAMKKSATIKKVDIRVPDKPSGNGRTERRTLTEDQIRKRLSEGYEPGKTTQIATSTMQLCLSKIQMAINARWRELNPSIGVGGSVLIAVRFDLSGRMVNCRLVESCGDKTSDNAAMTVVRTVGPIAGLDRDFIREFSRQDLHVRYKVQSR